MLHVEHLRWIGLLLSVYIFAQTCSGKNIFPSAFPLICNQSIHAQSMPKLKSILLIPSPADIILNLKVLKSKTFLPFLTHEHRTMYHGLSTLLSLRLLERKNTHPGIHAHKHTHKHTLTRTHTHSTSHTHRYTHKENTPQAFTLSKH